LTTTLFHRATHFSIIWGVSLAVITVLEWNSLDRNPVQQEIFSPFIERTMTVEVEEPDAQASNGNPSQQQEPDATLNYQVSFHFNGPLFLACFFTPILVFHGLGALWGRLRHTPG